MEETINLSNLLETGGSSNIPPNYPTLISNEYPIESKSTLPDLYYYDTEIDNETGLDTKTKLTTYDEPIDVSYWTPKSPIRFGSIFTPTTLGDSTIEGTVANDSLVTTNYEKQNSYPLNMNISAVDLSWDQNNPLKFPYLNSLNTLSSFNINEQTNEINETDNIFTNPEKILSNEKLELPFGNSISSFNKATDPDYQAPLTKEQLYTDYGMYDNSLYSGVIKSPDGSLKFIPLSTLNSAQSNIQKIMNPTQPQPIQNDINKLLLSQLNLANKARLDQLNLAKEMANKQFDYLSNRDKMMQDLQKSTLSQQSELAKSQLSEQTREFDLQYNLAKEQYEWQKLYQNTLLRMQVNEYNHQNEVRQYLTSKFSGKPYQYTPAEPISVPSV